MGYFSRLDRSSQLSEAPPLPMAQRPEPEPVSAQPTAREAATTEAELAAGPAAKPAAPESAAKENSISTVVALESGPDTDDDAARRVHEESESKRKDKWEAQQREKKAAEQTRLSRLAAMSDEDVVAASVQRVSADTEKLTRRSMKDYFNDPDVQEDREKEEKFTSRPYVAKSSKSYKTAAKTKKESTPKAAPKPKLQPGVDGQLSLLEAAGA